MSGNQKKINNFFSLSTKQSGQAVTEYILMVAVIVSFYAILARVFKNSDIGPSILKPIQKDYANAYQFGHPEAKGFDSGGPEKHPRFEGGDNFRLFANPRKL